MPLDRMLEMDPMGTEHIRDVWRCPELTSKYLEYVGSVCARPCWTEHFAENNLTHQTVLHQPARRISCVCPSFLAHRYLGQGKESKRISQGNKQMHLTEPNWWITGGQWHLVLIILKTNASMLRALPAQDAKKCPRTRVDDGFVLVHADRLIFGASALRQSHVGRICWLESVWESRVWHVWTSVRFVPQFAAFLFSRLRVEL